MVQVRILADQLFLSSELNLSDEMHVTRQRDKSPLAKVIRLSDLLALHGTKGAPGYELLHSPYFRVAKRANAIYKAERKAGVPALEAQALVVPGKLPGKSAVSKAKVAVKPKDPYDEAVRVLDARLAKTISEVGDSSQIYDNLPDARHQWTPEREAMHDKIIAQLLKESEHMPRDRKAVVLAGVPGAGKTTLINNSGNDFGVSVDTTRELAHGLNPTNFAVVSGDNMKELILQEGGLPTQFSERGLLSNEAAPLVHEEAAYLADRYQAALMARGTNLILDGTFGGSSDWNMKKLDLLHSQGYKVTGVLIDAPADMAIAQAKARYRQHQIAPNAEGHYLGRYLPIPIVVAQGQTGGAVSKLFNRPARSKNAMNFEDAVQSGKLDSAFIYDTLTRDKNSNPALAWRD